MSDTRQRSYSWDDQEATLMAGATQHGLSSCGPSATGRCRRPCAVHSLLPAAHGYVTDEMNVRFLRPARLTGGTLVCTGEVLHPGRSTMVAEARVVDGGGRVVAVAGATCILRGLR